MKKVFLSLALMLLSVSGVFAAPHFKGLNNHNGKTTIKVEIPASDRDATNGLSIDNVILLNDGEKLTAKKVDAIWGDDSTIIMEFKKLKTFKDCTLFFTVNGQPVKMDIKSLLEER